MVPLSVAEASVNVTLPKLARVVSEQPKMTSQILGRSTTHSADDCAAPALRSRDFFRAPDGPTTRGGSSEAKDEPRRAVPRFGDVDPAPATLGEPTIRADNERKEISMGMRRRARRRGMLAGAVAGGAIAHHRAKREYQDNSYDDYQEQTQYAPPPASSADELEHLAQLHSSGVLSDDEFAAAKAKVLGT